MSNKKLIEIEITAEDLGSVDFREGNAIREDFKHLPEGFHKEGLLKLFGNKDNEKRDYRDALSIFLEGIEKEGCAECCYEAARLYYIKYEGSEYNPQKGIELFKKAAEKGHKGSVSRLKDYGIK